MSMCDSCPNRHLADLFEALGELDKAREIRAKGCEWWSENLQTFHYEGGFGVETYRGCARSWIPKAMVVLWHAAGHAAAAYNDARDKVISAGGLPNVVSELVGLGMVTIAGGSKHQIGRGETDYKLQEGK